MQFYRDKRVWWAVGLIVILLILAWALGWFSAGEAPTTAPTPTQ